MNSVIREWLKSMLFILCKPLRKTISNSGDETPCHLLQNDLDCGTS